MKTYSIMQSQHNLSRILREVEGGEAVGITRRKKLVAHLVPVGHDESVEFPDFGGRARRLWGEEWRGVSSDVLVAEARGER
jgi:antitoxin (DNA-binding transcriptional repressor) of toxin-antitoxin stability system